MNILFTLTQEDLLQEALAVTFAKDQTQALNIPVKVPLGGGRYAELTEWNGSKRVDLRFWKTDTIPTNVGVSLSLPQWKVLYSHMQVVDDLIRRVKDGEPVDWRYDLGEDVYVIIKAPPTENSHQEVLRAYWRMDIASCEERSDPKSLRTEGTEKDHTFI